MISIYDFDGVLACPIEDAVFRLDANTYKAMDDEFIKLGRERYGITKLTENMARNRHIILQEILYETKKCPDRGPKFTHMKYSGNPFYVLTARSGPGAVARVSQFFESHRIRPEEMFFVGPVSKTHILIDLCHKFEDQELEFFDDTHHHIVAANDLGLPNLTVHYVDNKVDNLTEQADALYILALNWLRNQ